MRYVTPILVLFSIVCAASHTYAIDYEVSLSYDKDLSDEAEAASSVELKNPHKQFMLPWIGINATDIILETDELLFKWRTALGFQYGKIEAPSGFYFNTANMKIDFIEPSVAESQKYQLNIALEIVKNLNDETNLYSGVGFKYDEEKVTYSLGDWEIKEYQTATIPQLYLGLNYNIFNDGFLSHLTCQATYHLRNNLNLQCAIGIPLN